MTYIDLMLAWDMMAGLGGLKISHLSTIRLFLEDGAETASYVHESSMRSESERGRGRESMLARRQNRRERDGKCVVVAVCACGSGSRSCRAACANLN